MPRRVSRPLVALCALLLVVLAGHDASHLIDDGLETKAGQLALIAVPQWIVLAIVMAVIVRGDRQRGATAALLLGVGVVLGFAAAHLLPFAAASYWDLSPSAASWALAWVPVALGLVVAARAWSERRQSQPKPTPNTSAMAASIAASPPTRVQR